MPSARAGRVVPAAAVGVCGFGRCGSTMTMQMLIAAGCPPVAGAELPPHESDLRSLWTARREALDYRAVKLLDSVLWYDGVPPASMWRFVWLDRDPAQQARSQVKFVSAVTGRVLPDDTEARLAESYGRDRPRALGMLRRVGQVLVMQYERVLANPRRAARELRTLWPSLDVDAAARAVHERDGRCLPDIAVEVAVTRQAGPRPLL